jgi:hypothetical protein
MLTRVIYAPDGKRYAPIVGFKDADRLPPTAVKMFDLRLGLDSPFPKL